MGGGWDLVYQVIGFGAFDYMYQYTLSYSFKKSFKTVYLIPIQHDITSNKGLCSNKPLHNFHFYITTIADAVAYETPVLMKQTSCGAVV